MKLNRKGPALWFDIYIYLLIDSGFFPWPAKKMGDMKKLPGRWARSQDRCVSAPPPDKIRVKCQPPLSCTVYTHRHTLTRTHTHRHRHIHAKTRTREQSFVTVTQKNIDRVHIDCMSLLACLLSLFQLTQICFGGKNSCLAKLTKSHIPFSFLYKRCSQSYTTSSLLLAKECGMYTFTHRKNLEGKKPWSVWKAVSRFWLFWPILCQKPEASSLDVPNSFLAKPVRRDLRRLKNRLQVQKNSHCEKAADFCTQDFWPTVYIPREKWVFVIL